MARSRYNIDLLFVDVLLILLLPQALYSSEAVSLIKYVDETDTAINFTCPLKQPGKWQKLKDITLIKQDSSAPVPLLTLENCNSSIAICMGNPNTELSCTNHSETYYCTIKVNITQFQFFKTLECLYEADFSYNHDIFIIVKPQNVSCQAPTLIDDNTLVSITCTTVKAFPEISCTFFVKMLKMFEIPVKVTYTPAKGNSSNCTWVSHISNFEPANYTFDVVMHPNVTNDTHFWVNVSLSSGLSLSLPTVKLQSNCSSEANILDGFTKPNTTVKCTCYLENTGVPPGEAQWFNQTGSLINSYSSKSTTLIIYPSSTDSQYICKGVTKLKGEGNSVFYNVTYAVGPTLCSVASENTTKTLFNMCYNTTILLNTICQVDKYNARPGVKSIIFINDSMVPVNNLTSYSYEYTAKRNIELLSPGNTTILCQAQNSKFGEINTSCSYTVLVVAPPTSNPTITIDNKTSDQVFSVKENSDSTLICGAPGGLPLVSNISVSCGNISQLLQLGNIFKSPITFTRNMNGQKCVCTAQHVSGCYTKNTTIKQLNIQYAAIVRNLTTNDSTGIVDEGTILHFECLADGNPAPNISISSGNKILQDIQNNYRLTFSKNMTCRDTGIYSCLVNNEIMSEIQQKEKKLTISIRCPLQFSSDENFKNFSLQLGKIFFYNFTVYGYPGPDRFIVLKSQKESTNIKVTNTLIDPPFFTVELQILKLTYTDFDNYTIAIFQNGLHNLNFNFVIKEANETFLHLPEKEGYLAAAAGGGITAGCLVIILVVSFYLFRRGKPYQLEKLEKYSTFENLTFDTTNGDICSMNKKLKENPKKVKEIESETYRNYIDIVPTITSATAIPKNLYKHQATPKPKIKKDSEYYNFIEALILPGHDLSDEKKENVYANQGFNPL